MNPKTPILVNYRILAILEQMMTVVSQGTDLGLVDLISAMLCGYFLESRGAVTPAVEAYLRQQVASALERARRTRRASKALVYGRYNLWELIERVSHLIEKEGLWQRKSIANYHPVAVDITYFKRSSVRGLESKGYMSEAQRALPAVPLGMIAKVGQVNGQNIALLKSVVETTLKTNETTAHHQRIYQEVAKRLEKNEVAIFEAGFSILDAVEKGIERCVMRLAKNSTFGATPAQVPARSSAKGPTPSRPQAKIVRPQARQHGQKTLPATPSQRTAVIQDEQGRPMRVEIWDAVYFLERHLDPLSDLQKKKLRQTPLKVCAFYHQDFDAPLLLVTPFLSLTPQAMYDFYRCRWPVEGLPQTAKYILSGGGGVHHIYHLQALQRLPCLSLLAGSLLKYVAATSPPIRTGFWDRAAKPTYGRLLKHFHKVGIPLSTQLFKKRSVTAHLPVGYEAVRQTRPILG